MEIPDTMVEKVMQIDPVVDLDYDYKPEDVIRKGPIEKTVYVLPSDSLSDSNIVIQNITPPSLTTVTERCFRLQYSLLVGVSFPTTSNGATYPFCNAVAGPGVVRTWPAAGTVGGGVLVAPAYVAGAPALDPQIVGNVNTVGNGQTTFSLRAFPLQSSLSTLDLRINGNSTSIPSNDLICLQPYLMDNEEIEYYASDFPCQRDNSSLYTASTVDDGNNRNPFAQYRQNGAVQSRGSHLATLIYEAVNANVVYRVYRFFCTEQLVISPLVWGKCFNTDGFANIVNITMNLRIQDINRSLSAVPLAGYAAIPATCAIKATLQSLTWNAVAQPNDAQVNFLALYNTQDPILSARMGQNLFYDYDLIQTDANSNAIAAGLNNASNDGGWTGNTLRINTIPDQVYVVIKPRKGQLNGTTAATVSDTFLRITGLKINYNNRSNMLSSYTEADIYRMSVKNNVRLSWHEWQYTNGSIVCIDIASDLGLNSDEAAGQNKFNTIQVSGNFSCAPLRYSGNANAVLYDVMTIVVTQGKAIISPNKADFTVGGVSTSEVLALSTAKDNVVDQGVRSTLTTSRGGSFFGKMGKLLHKGLDLAKKVKPEHLELAQTGLKHLGLGGEMSGGQVVAGRLRKHKRAY